MPMSVANALATGVSREACSCAAVRAVDVPAPLRPVERDRGGIGDGARGARERTHGEQHALHVGMQDDRARVRGIAGGATLPALARVGQGLLGRPLGDRHALQSDRQPRLVHHGEHAAHAAVLLADQKAGRAAVVAVDHGAGGRGVDAELVLDRMHAHVVAPPGPAVGAGEELGDQEERDALGSGRRVRKPSQHHVDDVVGEIVLAVGDEDLLAHDPVAAVGGSLGARAQGADVGAGLRLGELHGAHPFARDQPGQIGALELVGAVRDQRVDRRHGEQRAEAEGHGRRVPHLDAGRIDGVRQLLASPLRGSGEPVPAGLRPSAIGFLPARGSGDGAVLEGGTVTVADRVQRRENIGREPAGLLEHRVDHVAGEVVEQALGQGGAQARCVPEGEGDVGNRCAIGHRMVSVDLR